MRGFLAVAQREVGERRMWLVAAVVAGLIPLAAPLLPWVSAQSAAEARNALASVLATTLVTAGAFVLGMSMIGTELAERRLGFYFARPLSPGAIWWGKLTASFLVVALVGGLVVLPTALLGGELPVRELPSLTGDGARLGGVLAALVLLLLLAAHALSVAGRSRSLLLVLDLAVAVALGAALWAMCTRFLLNAPGLLVWLLVASSAAVLVALGAAGWAQVAVGRTDPRRGHRALSATLWGTLGSFALLLVGYAVWVFSAAPSSIARLWETIPAQGGSWTVVSGSSSGRGDYSPMFLLDTESGRWLRVEVPGRWWPAPLFSEDGHLAVWQEWTGRDPRDPLQVLLADLAVERPRTVATSLFLGEDVRTMGLSPSGRQLALAGEKTLSVYSLPDGGLVRAVRMEVGPGRVRLGFLGDGEVSLSTWDGDDRNRSGPVDVTLWRLDIPSGKLAQTGTLTGISYRDYWAMPGDPRGELLLATHASGGERELVLHDARTGVSRASLLSGPERPATRAAFLHDGRVLIGQSRAGADGVARVHVFDREGRRLRTIDLGDGFLGRLGSEVSPGVLTVSLGRDEDWSWRGRHDARVVLVDIERGTVQALAKGYLPVPTSGWWSPPRYPVEPGSACARLFRSPEGALVRYEPTTGGFTTILDTRWPL